VIAITAYTEPVTASAPVYEPQQSQKIEENENPNESFEEILAGVLNNNPYADSDQTQNKSFSVEHFDVLLEGDLELNFTEIDLSGENQSILLSAQAGIDDNLFIDSLDNFVSIEDSIDDSALRNDISSLSKDNKGLKTDVESDNLAKSVSQTGFDAAAKQNSDETSDEIAKKDVKGEKKVSETISKADSESIVSSLNRSGENEFSRDKQENRSSEGGRLDELRSRSRRDKFYFDVRDQRTMTDISHNTQRSFFSVDAAAGRLTDASVKDITFELRLPDYNNAGQTAQTTWEAKASNAMENMLARELHQNLNGDIVRHASVALRDGGESIIRLNLKPESLGNVKIRLEMTDNKITGYILVESEEALNAFKKELTSLEQAFKDAGFNDANLDLSLADDGRNAQDNAQNELDKAFMLQMAASGYEGSLREEALIDIFGYANDERSGFINILA